MLRQNIKLNTKMTAPKYQQEETKVRSGLSPTPAQMWDLMKQGKPISSFELDPKLFNDGDPYQTYDIPLDQQRGIDINDMWNAQQDGKRKFSQFREHMSKQSKEGGSE